MYNKEWRSIFLFFMLFVPALVSAQSLSTLFEGEGTKESPFLIKTAQDLVALSNYCNNGGSTLNNWTSTYYFQQIDDIDMSTLTPNSIAIRVYKSSATKTYRYVYNYNDDFSTFGSVGWHEFSSSTKDEALDDITPAYSIPNLPYTWTSPTGNSITFTSFNEIKTETKTQVGKGNDNNYQSYRKDGKQYIDSVTETYRYEIIAPFYNFEPISDFKGRFDGAGRLVANLVSIHPNDNVGLFKNVAFCNQSFLNNGILDEKYIAAVYGAGLLNPIIVGGANVGGIVATTHSIQYIKDCCVQGGMIMGTGYVGGIVGDINDGNNILVGDATDNDISGKIISCYNNKTMVIIKGCENATSPGAGGIVGGLHYELHSCYSTAKIKVISDCPTTGYTYYISPIGNKQSDNYKVESVYYLEDWNEEGLPMDNLSYRDASRQVVDEDALKDSVLNNLDGFYKDDLYGSNDSLPITYPRYTWDSIKYYRNRGTVKFDIYVRHWNLVATTQSGATFDILKYNNVADGTPNNLNLDVVASKYDYYENTWWAVNWLLRYDPMDKGNGYFIWPYDKDTLLTPVAIPATSDSVMTWTQNADITGNFDVSLHNTGSIITGGPTTKAYWFSLGNSYKETLYLKPFYNDNTTDIQGEYAYTYDAKKEQWKNIAFDTGAVASTQGFMVAGQTNTITVHYKTSHLTRQTSKFATNNSKMSFIASSTEENAIEKTAIARMQADAENTFDSKDSYVMISNARNDLVEPYFVVEDKSLYSNVFKSLPYTTAFNLHTGQDTYAKLSVKDIPEDINVVLIDAQDNSETVLGEEPIVLQLSQGENTDRFTVRFEYKNVSLEQNALVSDININLYANTLYISGANLQNLEIYSVDGKKVFEKALFGDNDQTDLHLANGVYIVKAKSKTNSCTQKIVVNK